MGSQTRLLGVLALATSGCKEAAQAEAEPPMLE